MKISNHNYMYFMTFRKDSIMLFIYLGLLRIILIISNFILFDNFLFTLLYIIYEYECYIKDILLF
jgi:hypothetical protein